MDDRKEITRQLNNVVDTQRISKRNKMKNRRNKNSTDQVQDCVRSGLLPHFKYK